MKTDYSGPPRPGTDLVIEFLDESVAASASVCYCIADYTIGTPPAAAVTG
jgi:hypothetical protein